MTRRTATIAKHFTFDAAHRLERLPEGHMCNRLHGHTYQVEIVLFGPIDESTGFVLDYDEIRHAWREAIHSKVDHRYLNEVPGLEVPTTEVIAHWIARELAMHRRLQGPLLDPTLAGTTECTLLYMVRVKESSTTWCEVPSPTDDPHVPKPYGFYVPAGSYEAKAKPTLVP